MQAFWASVGALGGLGLGLAAGRLSTGSMDSKTRANVTLATSFAGAAAGAATVSYYTTKNLQLST